MGCDGGLVLLQAVAIIVGIHSMDNEKHALHSAPWRDSMFDVARPPSRFSAVLHLGGPVFRRFCDRRRLEGRIRFFGTKTSTEHATK